jgi:hypothetical protein
VKRLNLDLNNFLQGNRFQRVPEILWFREWFSGLGSKPVVEMGSMVRTI